MRRSRTITALLIGFTVLLSRAGAAEFFGLELFPVGEASLSSNQYNAGFSIADLSTDGTNGVTTILGEADSGAFFFPDVSSPIANGYFMRADAYGLVDGNTNALIGKLSGSRGEYATFYVNADYTSIGATSLTFQAWNGDVLLAETNASTGAVTLYTEYSRPVRANPWWPQPNGEYGASIELHYTAQVSLPGWEGPAVFANRLFIRPNGATSTVISVSRTDVLGGGGLESFQMNDIRLGMFGNAHVALGEIKYAASNRVLRVNALNPFSEDGNGTLVQFDHTTTAEVRFEPLEIARPTTNEIHERIDINCSGTLGSSDNFISAATLENSNGVLRLSTYRFNEFTTELAVYSNSVLVATQTVSVPDTIFITGGPRLSAIGAKADTLSSPAGMSIDFDAPAAFELSQGTIVGNRVTLSAPAASGVVNVAGLAMLARVLPSFTITNESSTSIPARLSITRSNEFVILRWADPAAVYSLQELSFASDYRYTFAPEQITRTNGMASFIYRVTGEEVPEALFFQLIRYFYND
jgi:hypothetical protein